MSPYTYPKVEDIIVSPVMLFIDLVFNPFAPLIVTPLAPEISINPVLPWIIWQLKPRGRLDGTVTVAAEEALIINNLLLSDAVKVKLILLELSKIVPPEIFTQELPFQ